MLYLTDGDLAQAPAQVGARRITAVEAGPARSAHAAERRDRVVAFLRRIIDEARRHP